MYSFVQEYTPILLTLVMLNKWMPRPLPIFSQSDYLIQDVDINSHTEWQTVQIQFRSQLIWIYTVCKDRVYPGSAGQGLRRQLPVRKSCLSLQNRFTGVSIHCNSSEKKINQLLLTHFRLNNPPPPPPPSPLYYIWEESNFNFRYVRLCDLDVPREKWLKSRYRYPDQMPYSAARRLVWDCTVCQYLFWGSPDFWDL